MLRTGRSGEGEGGGEISQRTNTIAAAAIEQRKEGERISVEVELHNLNLEDLKKIERKERSTRKDPGNCFKRYKIFD